jgi:hypothetical protein
MTETIAGVTSPDTVVVKAATELALDTEDELLFHHSRRVYLWGTLKSRRRGRRPDPEMSYVGAMFHDLGLTPKYRTDNQRFEVDGADIARHGQRWWNIRAPISPPNGCWFWAASCEAAPGVATT